MKTTSKLILVDHDGTLCRTSSTAFDSLRYAIEHAINEIGFPADTENLANYIDSAFSDTSGTTEKNFLNRIAFIIGLPSKDIDKFQEYAYQGRAMWYKSMKESHEFIYDTYYPDIEQLLRDIKKRGDICMLVTGNPSKVAEERLSKSASNFFSNDNGQLMGGFGEEANRREELIELAIKRASSLFKQNFSDTIDRNGFHENVYYFGDTKNDCFAGLRARVKTIWIPSRSLQIVKDVKTNEYVKIINEVLNDELIIVNDCNSTEVRNFLNL